MSRAGILMLFYPSNIHIEKGTIQKFAQLPAYLMLTFPPNRISMSNRGLAYGLSREVQHKIDQKYDPELEARLVEWFVVQFGAERPEPGKTGFQNWLKDGCVSVGVCIIQHCNSPCVYSIFRGICFFSVCLGAV